MLKEVCFASHPEFYGNRVYGSLHEEHEAKLFIDNQLWGVSVENLECDDHGVFLHSA